MAYPSGSLGGWRALPIRLRVHRVHTPQSVENPTRKRERTKERKKKENI